MNAREKLKAGSAIDVAALAWAEASAWADGNTLRHAASCLESDLNDGYLNDAPSESVARAYLAHIAAALDQDAEDAAAVAAQDAAVAATMAAYAAKEAERAAKIEEITDGLDEETVDALLSKISGCYTRGHVSVDGDTLRACWDGVYYEWSHGADGWQRCGTVDHIHVDAVGRVS